MIHIQVLVDDRFLASALTRAIGVEVGEHLVATIDRVEQATSPSLIVTVPTTCSPEAAAELVNRGCRLLLLAPFLRRPAKERYERAGARVALMDSRTLVAEIRQALSAANAAAPIECSSKFGNG